jgi:dihydrodipicolinate synthase/N-acetylneuraminate lyase
MRIDWRGVFPAVCTQFHKNLSLDLEATQRHIEVLIDSGSTGLVMLGSLGENTTLDRSEKRRVIRAAIEAAAGRVPVLSGVAETSTASAMTYARELERLGANGLLLLPAMIYKADARETLVHLRTVTRATGLPIICYNNPLAYHVDITPTMFAELAREKNLVAIKESSGDLRRFTDIQNLVGDRYRLFAGIDDLVLESVLVGAVGWIAGLTLAFPREGQKLWGLMQRGDWTSARKLYRWFMPLMHLDTHLKFVQYIKLAVQEAGYGSEWVRPPRLTLTGRERRDVLKIIRTGLATRPVRKKP